MTPVENQVVQLQKEVAQVKADIEDLKEGMKQLGSMIGGISRIAERALNKSEHHTHTVDMDRFTSKTTSGPHFNRY